MFIAERKAEKRCPNTSGSENPLTAFRGDASFFLKEYKTTNSARGHRITKCRSQAKPQLANTQNNRVTGLVRRVCAVAGGADQVQKSAA